MVGMNHCKHTRLIAVPGERAADFQAPSGPGYGRDQAKLEGVVLSKTSIVLNAGAGLTGRALAQTAVTLDSTSVTAP